MQKLYLLFFLLFTIALTAQHESISVEDYNNDGIDDTLKCAYQIGSSFGGGDCTITDGKTKNIFRLNNYACFCSIKKRVFVAPELQEKQNEYFLYTLKKEILPSFKPKPDQSLTWLIYTGLHTSKPKDNTHFNLIFTPKTAWRYEAPELPTTYYIEIDATTLSKMSQKDGASDQPSTTSNKKDYLVYFGDSHSNTDTKPVEGFISVAKNKTYEILKTKHGVIVKKGEAYKWLFVTDIDSNDAPQKLRWASIEEVILKGDYIVIKQSLAPDPEYHIYLIDIETGMGGRLKIDFDYFVNLGIEIPDLSKEEQFSIEENTLVIGRKKKKLKFSLDEIKASLQ